MIGGKGAIRLVKPERLAAYAPESEDEPQGQRAAGHRHRHPIEAPFPRELRHATFPAPPDEPGLTPCGHERISPAAR